MTRRKKTVMILCGIILFISVLIGIFNRYTANYYVAKEYDPVSMMDVEKDYIVYGDTSADIGFIFYPGALVDEMAYEELMDNLAQAGICSVLVKMPKHLAILAPNRAEEVMENLPDVGQWYIGGHSLGGAMAANFASKNQDKLAGVILLAAYSQKKIDSIPVLSLYGSEDTVLNIGHYEEYKSNITDLTEYVIDGGNHGNFGNYGDQKGDGEATIDNDEQCQITVDMILKFMGKE